jgi:class 3 adenylate cyclase/tetratricopeptide (TPR) repeat protein
MDALLAYVPEDRAHALAWGKVLPDRAYGTALFADISGFTPLTEALTQALGRRAGIEALTEQINTAYAALTAAVAEQRGSVIGFAGDAITCWFDEADRSAALRAAACAINLQAAMAPFAALTLPVGCSSLALKIAVATGPARRLVVGDPAIQRIDVLAGALLDRVATCEHLARPGEVLIDDTTRAALGDAALVSEQRIDPVSGTSFTLLHTLSRFPKPRPWEPVTLSADDLRPWVPRAIWEREAAGLGAFLTELRQVVALFLRFGGIDFDADDAGTRLDTLIRGVQAVLADLGGTLLQLTVGDKGAYLYAVFGAPVAHEDDARRAARAALALHASAKALGLPPFQIGLSQGVVRAGAYGGLNRRAYGALGDEINVAARLMQHAAPGQTVATGHVHTRIGATMCWEQLSAVMPKGKKASIPTYRLVGLQQTEAGISPPTSTSGLLVGRQPELACLEGALTELAITGAPQTVVIEGEAGIGKSQLALALLAQARDRGLPTLLGVSDAVEQRTPYFAWRGIVSQLLGLTLLPDDLSARQLHVLARLRAADEPVELAPLLNAVLPLQFPENVFSSQLIGAIRAENVNALLIRLLKRAARVHAPLVVLEDVHWLDPSSWVLFRQAAQEVPALFVLTTRPPGLQPDVDYQHLQTYASVQWLRLGPLADEELLSLLCARLGAARLAPAVAELILTRSDGNPYFSVELAATLLERNVVQIQNGMCSINPHMQSADVTLPESLEGVISHRLDQLPPDQQLTVKVASVIGRVFAAGAVHAIHPLSLEVDQLRGHLDAAERLNLTIQETPEPQLAYMFRHIIAQEVAYSLLPGALQRVLHAAVAGWLEHTYTADLSPYALLLAYHWETAHELVRARDYFDLAGSLALRGGAYREALELLTKADALDTKRPGQHELGSQREHAQALLRRVRRARMLGEAQFGLGEPARSRPHLRQALRLLGRPIPTTAAGLIAGSAKQLVRVVALGERPPRAARSDTLDAQLTEEAAVLYGLYSRITYGNNETLLAVYVILWYLFLAKKAAPAPLLAQAYVSAGAIFTALRLDTVAERYMTRATTLAARPELAMINNFLSLVQGMTNIGQARWERGMAQLEHSITTSRTLNDWRTWGDSTVMLGLALYYQGQFAQSRRWFEELATIGAQRGSLEHQAYGHNGLGMVALRRGDLDAAGEHLERAAVLLDRAVELQMATLMNHGARAILYGRQGKWHEAASMAVRVEQTTGVMPHTFHPGIDGLIGWAEVAVQLQGRRSEGAQRAGTPRRAVAALQRYALIYPLGRPAALRFKGRLRWQQGKHAVALRAWRQSLAEATRLAMPYDEALAHAELGLHLPLAESLRHEHLARAITLLTHLGADFDLERIGSTYLDT